MIAFKMPFTAAHRQVKFPQSLKSQKQKQLLPMLRTVRRKVTRLVAKTNNSSIRHALKLCGIHLFNRNKQHQ
jgi:hypothetical protein